MIENGEGMDIDDNSKMERTQTHSLMLHLNKVVKNWLLKLKSLNCHQSCRNMQKSQV